MEDSPSKGEGETTKLQNTEVLGGECGGGGGGGEAVGSKL